MLVLLCFSISDCNLLCCGCCCFSFLPFFFLLFLAVGWGKHILNVGKQHGCHMCGRQLLSGGCILQNPAHNSDAQDDGGLLCALRPDPRVLSLRVQRLADPARANGRKPRYARGLAPDVCDYAGLCRDTHVAGQKSEKHTR